MLRDLSRTRRRRSARRERSRVSSCWLRVSSSAICRAARTATAWGAAVLARALNFSHLLVDEMGERVHVRLVGV